DGTEIGRLRAPHIDSWTAPLEEAALRGVSLTAGTHVLRLQVGPLDWIDVDWVRIDPSAAPPAAAAPSASGGDASAGGRMLLHHPAQSPFFADATGQGVVLTGAHTWNDGGQDIDGHPFDWTGYLDWLQAHNMNF